MASDHQSDHFGAGSLSLLFKSSFLTEVGLKCVPVAVNSSCASHINVLFVAVRALNF